MAPFLATIDPACAPVLANAARARALFAAGFTGLSAEAAGIAFLDERRRLIATGRISDHHRSKLALPVRQILARSLAVGADALVLAHNHPLGDPAPSAADIAATRAFALAAGLVGLRLVDHLVFGGTRCHSFRQLGLL